MRGFLQRVAASALRTAPKMHPLVEPIYAAPRVEEQPVSSLRFEPAVHSVVPQPRVGQTAPPELSEDRSQSSRNVADPHPQNRPLDSFLGPERNSVEPLMQPSIGKSDTNSNPAERPSGATAGSSELSLESATASSPESSRTGVQGEIRSRGRESLPIVVERLMKADASDGPEAARMQTQPLRKEPEARTIAAQVNARRQQPAVLQPSRPTQSQPEDIQIHIGRIEVLAVPQAAPRPAAAPARKGLSLDEYLSRRNGRSG